MKVLIIGLNYSPEKVGTAVYTAGMAEHLAKQGYEIHVIAGKPYYPAWKIMDGHSAWGWSSRLENGVRVVRVPHYVPSQPSGGKRLLHHASFALSSFFPALWAGLTWRPDVVFAVAPSLIAAPVGWLAAVLADARSWLHVQDFEVEAAFSTNLLNKQSRVGRVALVFERWILGRFQRVSTISGPMVDKLLEKGVARGRRYELRNWANLEKVTPVEGVSPMRAELGIETPYVALYSGNLANKQGLEIVPDVARLLAHRTDLTFVICGEGPMRNTLEKLSHGINSIRFLPLQPLEKLSHLLGMADVHLLPQIASAADLMLPSKLTNILASGRPVVATAAPDTALAHEISGCGRATTPGDAADMASAIEALLDAPEERARLGAAAKARAWDCWHSRVILGRLEIALKQLNADR